jgi:uroporphyrin-3 C-methyltransferase
MSDPSLASTAPVPPVAPVPSAAPAASPEAAALATPKAERAGQPEGWWQSRGWTFSLLGLAAAGVVGSFLTWQKLESIQGELARRSQDSGAQAIEARTLAREAQEGSRDLSARLASVEARLSEVSLQRSQLEELMQSLTRSRDDNLVVDLEVGLRLAQQQSQLTGSTEPLLAALKSAEQRLARAAQPRLSPVQRAIAKDTERVRGAALTDVPALLLRLDELTRLVDELPTANAVGSDDARLLAPPSSEPTSSGGAASSSSANTGIASNWLSGQALKAWFSGAWQLLRSEAQALLRVSRIDQPEAALLAPEQSYFLRENMKLKLLNARLALLSRQTEVARADLANVQTSLLRYFDVSARKTVAANSLLKQVQSQLRTGELPRLDETLAALATAASGR